MATYDTSPSEEQIVHVNDAISLNRGAETVFQFEKDLEGKLVVTMHVAAPDTQYDNHAFPSNGISRFNELPVECLACKIKIDPNGTLLDLHLFASVVDRCDQYDPHKIKAFAHNHQDNILTMLDVALALANPTGNNANLFSVARTYIVLDGAFFFKNWERLLRQIEFEIVSMMECCIAQDLLLSNIPALYKVMIPRFLNPDLFLRLPDAIESLRYCSELPGESPYLRTLEWDPNRVSIPFTHPTGFPKHRENFVILRDLLSIFAKGGSLAQAISPEQRLRLKHLAHLENTKYWELLTSRSLNRSADGHNN